MEKGFIFSIIFAVIVGLFAMNNGEKVEIDLIFTSITMSQAIVIFISALLGAIVVSFMSLVKSFHFKKEVKELNKKITVLEDEIKKKDEVYVSLEKEKNILERLIIEKDSQINTLVDINTDLPTKL